MVISPLIIAAVIFVGSLVWVHSTDAQPSEHGSTITVTPSVTPSDSEMPTPTQTPSPSPEPSSTPRPTSTLPPESPTQTPTPAGSQTNSSFPIYPGARLISSEGNIRIFETDTEAKIVGDWYKQQIQNRGFNIKSFINTIANSEVTINLAAAQDNSSVKIEITQKPGSSTRIQQEN